MKHTAGMDAAFQQMFDLSHMISQMSNSSLSLMRDQEARQMRLLNATDHLTHRIIVFADQQHSFSRFIQFIHSVVSHLSGWNCMFTSLL